MKIVDAIAEILKREGVTFLSAYPTTSVIDATAAVGIRSVLCRQERVGVGIADGFTRITNGKRPGVFAMQYGPGAENAFAGVATAYSDSTPILLLPLGHQRDRAQVFPLFSSARSYASVTKSVETLNLPDQVSEVMRRAFSLLKTGRPGPVMVEIPADVATAEAGDVVRGVETVPRLGVQRRFEQADLVVMVQRADGQPRPPRQLTHLQGLEAHGEPSCRRLREQCPRRHGTTSRYVRIKGNCAKKRIFGARRTARRKDVAERCRCLFPRGMREVYHTPSVFPFDCTGPVAVLR